MRAGEADAADAGHRADGAQQVGEQRAQLRVGVAVVAGAQLEVAAVAVHVLAEQRDLGDALAGELLHLGDDVAERTADLGAADAGTMQKAHELSQPIWMVTQALYEVSRRAGSADGNSAWSSRTASSRISVTGAVRGACCSSSAARCTLCVPSTTSTSTAPRSRTRSRSFWARHPATTIWRPSLQLLPRLQVAEVAVELVVGVLADAAGVEHDDVGVGLVVDRRPARRPRAARRCARNRVRSSGTRRCARRSCGSRLTQATGSGRTASRQPPARRLRPGDGGTAGEDGWSPSRSAQDSMSTSIGASSASVKPSTLVAEAGFLRTRSEISIMISGLSVRKFFAFSRPWPSCSPS